MLNIQDDIQKIADVIALALGTEVTIVDHDCILLAGSKKYRSLKGSKINGNFVKQGLRSASPILVTEPGRDPLCKGCYNENNCLETADLGVQIKLNGETVGLISLVAFNEEQRQSILTKTDTMIEFLHKIGDLIANKAMMQAVLDKLSVINKELEITLNSADTGIVTINAEGRIIRINERAKAILRIHDCIGSRYHQLLPYAPIMEVITKGVKFVNYDVSFEQGCHTFHLLISAVPINILGKVNGAVISFKDRGEITQLHYEITDHLFDRIIGVSKAIREVKEKAKMVAGSNSTVLIRGESGTGKELFAKLIHHSSHRFGQPFVTVNCAALPETLLESELFGYDEGAFTGAKKGGKIGKFEQAQRGTIFLDEIGDMSLPLQAKLLRVLQEKLIERVGGTQSIPINVRIIAATNRDLETMISESRFREDLYYRLNVIPIFLPALRERKEDISILADYFIMKYNKLIGKNIRSVSAEVLSVLANHNWPGNVRELENCIEYAMNFATTDEIQINSLPDSLAQDLETTRLRELFSKYGQSVAAKKAIAQKLGISIATLYRKIKQLK